MERDFRSQASDLLRLAGPIIVSQLGQVGMNTADTVMVGPLGPAPLAAAGLGSAMHFFGVVICMGVIVGIAPLVSQAFGAGDRRRCRQALVQGLWLALALSLPVMASCWTGEALALALGQDREVAALTGGYLQALTLGIPPLFAFIALRQYLEGMGQTRPAMLITFLGLTVNIAANWLLIYGVEGLIPAMGVVGSGWATTIVRWAMLLAMAAYLGVYREFWPFHGVSLAPCPRLLGRVVAIGAPIGAQFGMEVGLFAFAAVMMGWLGPVELAAHQVAINIASTTFMVALGVSLAGSIRVGQHIGAQRPGELRQAALATYLLATGFMALCALVFIVAPEPLLRLYTRDSGIIAVGARLLLLAAAFQVFDGAQVAGMSVLRGAADTRVPMVIAGLGYWGAGFPVAYGMAFILNRGAVGIWIGLSLGLALVALLLAVRVWSVLWRPSILPATNVAD